VWDRGHDGALVAAGEAMALPRGDGGAEPALALTGLALAPESGGGGGVGSGQGGGRRGQRERPALGDARALTFEFAAELVGAPAWTQGPIKKVHFTTYYTLTTR
jgi:hypothetical protein